MNSPIIRKLFDVIDRWPDATAVVHNDESITYEELGNQITSCACYLIDNGLEFGDRVAVGLPNSIPYIVAYYSILAAGGVVVPLNTAAKANDLLGWVRHSGSKWLIVDIKVFRQINDSIQGDDLDINYIIVGSEDDSTHNMWLECSNNTSKFDHRHLDVSEINPASIIYTSGTTGKPKGVTLSHKNIATNIECINNYLKITNTDSILNILPFYYSYGNSILHTHILSGAKIILEDNFIYPARSLAKIKELMVTGFSGVPSTYAILLNKIDLADYDLSSLRYMTQAGGPMPASNIIKIRQYVDDIDFYVMYGQTEATARLTYLEPGLLNVKVGSVGKPLDGITIEIRDRMNRILNDNEIGELYVKGDNVMLGYWKDEELTKQVLNDGFLKTGDLGYKDQDGFIYLTGRRSDMIKVGGHRISPVEIESIVCQLDGVEELAAVGVEDELLGQVIKLFVVKNDRYEIDDRIIKGFCREKLALYKIPKFVEFVNELPKTSSGKIKRFELGQNN